MKITKPLEYKVDFNKMNNHFIRNIPEPFFYPVLGCSQDPDFYRQEGMLTNPERNYYNKSFENRNYRYPHGGIYGYDTDVGIVPVPDEPIHGHVWKNGHEIRNRNDGKWIVHAEVDDGLPSRGSWSPPRRRGWGGPRGSHSTVWYSLSQHCTLTFPLSSQLRIMYRYYDMKYSSYQGLTASSSLVYRGAVYHENLSYR